VPAAFTVTRAPLGPIALIVPGEQTRDRRRETAGSGGGAAPPLVGAVDSPAPPDPVPSHGIRVLLVEDNVALRESLRDLLAEEGFVIAGEADDGEAGVAAALALEPDVVLMDMKMPKLDGIEATRRILAARPSQRVVILTAFSDSALQRVALDAGALGFLGKAMPFGGLHRILLETAGGSP
jgi:CheY-like chemotaxis protein